METPHYYYYSCNYTQTNSPKMHATHNNTGGLWFESICLLFHPQWLTISNATSHACGKTCMWPTFNCIIRPVYQELGYISKQLLLENVRSTTLLGWLSVGRYLLYFSSGMMTWAPHFVTRVYITSCGNPRTKPLIHRCIFHGASQTKLTGAFPRARQKVQSHQ